MAKETKEEAIARIMKGLHCSEEEALEVYEYDDKVNHGKRTEYDLTGEKFEVARKQAHVKEHAKSGSRKKPERKPNELKGTLIAAFADFLNSCDAIPVDLVEITNKERQIAFEVGEERFELTLTQKRKPKK